MTLNVGRETAIREMFAEIEASMAQTGVDFDNMVHRTYITATLEMGSPQPNTAYVHNILANALNKPLATRH